MSRVRTFIAINGAAGRMGRRLVALANESETMEAVVALEAPESPHLGQDACQLAGHSGPPLPMTATWPVENGKPVHADVLIDFSAPPGFRAAVKICDQLAAAGKPIALVVGTTGLTADDHQQIDDAAKRFAILQAANMSLGVNLLLGLAAQVAVRLGDDYDIEIVEAHHRFKVDAPSGTALAIAQAVCEATGKDITKDLVHGRHGGHVPRQRGEIGMHALRSGDVVGRHTISFGTLGEELSLSHVASTRDVFARGALKAAQWLAGKPAGRYSMKDVLGL
jgi:4-hydroxy-tetrahydrodipicolinate reductase